MLSSGEAAELRELQRRAYAPGGGLSAAEAVRLHELEDKRVMVAESPAAEPESVSATSVTEPVVDIVSPAADARPEAPGVGAAEDAGITDRAPRAKRRSPWAPLPAGAALLLVGLGAGWAIAESRHTPASVAVAAEQQERGEQIAPEGADPGSLIALGERGEVVAWYVTKDAGNLTCLILDGGGDEVDTSCGTDASLASLPLSSLVEVETGSGEDLDVTYATLTFSPDQRPAVILDGYRSQVRSADLYANAEEADIAADLREAGYRADSIYVLGYHGDTPLWSARRGVRDACLVYVQPDGASLSDCADSADGFPDSLTVEFVSTRDGIVYEVVAQLDSSPQSPGYLTITESAVGLTDVEVDVDVDSGAIVDDATGDAG